MGLVARRIEAAGIPTVTLNMIWVYHRIVGMPRVAAIEHPFGRPFGDVRDAETQRAVLWSIFERVRRGLTAQMLTTHAGMFTALAGALAAGAGRSSTLPPLSLPRMLVLLLM